jgi:hypothetical protein
MSYGYDRLERDLCQLTTALPFSCFGEHQWNI